MLETLPVCTYVAVFSFLHPRRCTYVYVHASTTTTMYVHVRDQNDNATYASTRWVPTVRHFLACENVAGGSQQSEGRIVFFARTHSLCMRRCSWWVPAVWGRIIFFARTHFLACEDVAGGSQHSGGESFFCPDVVPCMRRCSWRVPAVRVETFFSRNTVARPVGPRCQVEE